MNASTSMTEPYCGGGGGLFLNPAIKHIPILLDAELISLQQITNRGIIGFNSVSRRLVFEVKSSQKMVR